MIRRALAIVFALLLAAFPVLGLAAQQAPACSHCPTVAKADITPCHQHAPAPEKCHQCAGCASCAFFPIAAIDNPAVVPAKNSASHVDYRPLHFYRLSSPPLDRPPSQLPA